MSARIDSSRCFEKPSRNPVGKAPLVARQLRRVGGESVSATPSPSPRRLRYSSLIMGLVLVSGLIAWIPVITHPVSAYAPHAPIVIVDDTGFTNASGVVWGSGTASDPYIISGWEIDTTTGVGIFIMNTNAHFVIEGVFIHGTMTYDGIEIMMASNAAVMNSVVTQNAAAVFLYACSYIAIDNCTLEDNPNYGVYASESNFISVANSSLSSDGYGIYVDTLVNFLSVYNCSLSSNSYGGMNLYGGATNLNIDRCHMDDNQYDCGLYVGGAINGGRIVNSSFDLNYDSGTYVYDYCHDLLVQNNTMIGTGGDGISVYGGDRIFILNNTATANYNSGIVLGYGDLEGKCVIAGNNASANGNNGISTSFIASVLANNTVVGNEASGITIDGGKQSRVEHNLIADNADFGCYVGSSSTGNLFANNTFVGDGMFFNFLYAEDNRVETSTVNGKPLVYLRNVAGISIPAAGQVIALNSQRITIEGLDLSNSSVGVELWNCDDCTVSGVTSDGNYYGLYVKNHSTGNSVELSSFSWGEEGIVLDTYCDGNSFVTCDAVHNTLYGMYATLCLNDTLDDCNLSDNTYGLWLNTCSGWQVLGSFMNGNAWTGITMFAAGLDVIEGNMISYNLHQGIAMSSVSSCRVANNSIEGNGEEGIKLSYASNGNIIADNSILGNLRGVSLVGMSSIYTSGNTIVSNEVLGNAQNGFRLEYATANTIASNNVSGSSYGIYLVGMYEVKNWIYLNNFASNGMNAYSGWSGNTNYWNTSNMVTYQYGGNTFTGHLGNYWDNYAGVDANNNGVGDTPYAFPNGQDNYPLMTGSWNYIPEFPGAAVPVVVALLATLLVALRSARRK